MKSSTRLLTLVSLPAVVLALGCSNKPPPKTYSATPPSPAYAPPPTRTAQTPTGRPPGWSAPVWRGPIPTGGTTVGTTTMARPPSATAPIVNSPPPPPAYAPPTAAGHGYGFNWSSSLRQAQDSARAQGKLIFLEAGRKECGNCMFLKNEVIPSSNVNGELGSMSVGYYDDVDVTPYSDAFNLLQANVQGAGTLPLCGWVTADLRWVHGFWGRRDASKFQSEIAAARSTYERMSGAARPASGGALVGLPSIGSLPDAELADVSAELTDSMIDVPASPIEQPGAGASSPVLATTAPMPAPVAVEPEAVAVEIAPEPSTAPVFASMSPRVMPDLPASIPVAAPSVEETSRTFVREELKRAATALASRQYAEARSILSGVKEQAKGLPESREADKGEVAIYNLRKIEKAGASAEADKIRATAQRDLKDTVWVSLFA